MYNILSIFTGAGGIDIGFHGDFEFLGKKFPKLKFETKVAFDLNEFACKSLKRNQKYFPNTDVLHGNILTYDINSIKLDNVDVLLGGFPCVTFSMIGNRKGVEDDINGKLYESYANYVEHFKPKVFLAENVKGMLSANNGEAIKIIKKRFEDTGYNIKVYLVNFADLGVPQKRERVIFIGIRKDISTPFLSPEITHENKNITTEEAFEDVNNVLFNNEHLNSNELTIKRIAAIPEGGNFKDLPPELAIKASMSNIYKRLDRKKPSYTLIANGGGGTMCYHYSEPRALTNRERARIQSFPDDYIFIGNFLEVRKQIGNAVPCVGAYSFAKSIQNLLDGKYEFDINKKYLKEINIIDMKEK